MADRASNKQSVSNIQKLLININADPSSFAFHSNLDVLLSSQSSLANMQWEDPAIQPMALNTLKNLANELLDGGFSALDLHRSKALESLKSLRNISKVSPRNKSELEKKVAYLEHQIALYEEDLSHVSRALWRAITELRSMARRSGSLMLQEELPKTEEILRGMASLMSKKTLDSV